MSLARTCMAKLKVMNSTMGLRPAMAEPTPKPAKPASVMGVSRTRWGPNFCSSPRVICNAQVPTLQNQKTRHSENNNSSTNFERVFETCQFSRSPWLGVRTPAAEASVRQLCTLGVDIHVYLMGDDLYWLMYRDHKPIDRGGSMGSLTTLLGENGLRIPAKPVTRCLDRLRAPRVVNTSGKSR